MTAGNDRQIWQIFSTLTDLASLEAVTSRSAPARDKDDDKWKDDLEACLRRVLRPHDEAGFTGEDESDMVVWRRQLDAALTALTISEIRRQLCLPYQAPPPDALAHLARLFRSEAFLRYVNAYHYFAIRFIPIWNEFQGIPDAPSTEVCAETNTLTFALADPPLLQTPDADNIVQRFLNCVKADADDPAIRTALEFLDGFENTATKPVLIDLKEPSAFELWLRALRPETAGRLLERFQQIAKGLTSWATNRATFYLSLNPHPELPVRPDSAPSAPFNAVRPAGSWIVCHSAAARLALADIYWIAKLFRAEISPNGAVTYQKYNWLHLLRFHAIFNGLDGTADANPNVLLDLNRAEESIRSVFDLVCDLVQNSVEVTEKQSAAANAPPEKSSNLATKSLDKPEQLPDPQKKSFDPRAISWRQVFDEELSEISKQRGLRHYRDPTLAPQPVTGGGATAVIPENTENRAAVAREGKPTTHPGKSQPGAAPATHHRSGAFGWSARLRGLAQPANLIGLAFSGGGIRSATLNLGVLEGLQELDLLRHFDYISTVSGGGYIGSWLIGNVRRSAHWLGRFTDWKPSIAHLRKYSNYLAPRKGLFSADTLSIANTWLRNTFLIQLSALTWLFAMLLASLLAMNGFLAAGNVPWLDSIILGCSGIVVGASIFHSLQRISSGMSSSDSTEVWYCAVIPACIGATALASRLWGTAPLERAVWPCLRTAYTFSDLLEQAWRPWIWLLLLCASGFAALAYLTLKRNWLLIVPVVFVCTGVLYLELVTLLFAFRGLSTLGDVANSIAFVFGPPLALLAFWISIILLIGLCAGGANEAQREWWTRYGSALILFTGFWLVICAITLFGPWVVIRFLNRAHHTGGSWISWTTILGWLGTVISGVLCGKSSKTDGANPAGTSRALEIVAKVAAVLFIIGSFLLGATLLYTILFLVFGPDYSVFASLPLHVIGEFNWCSLLMALAVILIIGLLFSSRFEINIFGFSQFYRNRLVRCYLGATRWIANLRKPDPFTGFDFDDDMKIWRFRRDSPGVEEKSGPAECEDYRGPFPLLNCCLNLGGSSDLALNTRHGASFTLTPLRCGSDRPGVGYAHTYFKGTNKRGNKSSAAYADGIELGQAVAVSGAAVSPNSGYNTSSLVAFLLTMFNVRLGWWFPNPGQKLWRERGIRFSLAYLLLELFGLADETRKFVSVSDGGNFENLAVYELVRRRCKLIVACDAECDPDLHFGSLGKLIRLCAVDFGAEIDLRVDSIRPQQNGHSLAHCAVGTIKYSTGETGRIIYLKASITGDEDVSIAQYRSQNPSFPHESTADQFYTEDQFESYRRLGLEMVRSSFKGNVAGDAPLDIAERMFDVLTPAALSSSQFLQHAETLNRLWENFRKSERLMLFMKELLASSSMELALAVNAPRPGTNFAQPQNPGLPPPITDEEFCICLELIQLMENVFLDLRLDEFWGHPDYRGWAILFMRWARSPRFREIWKRTHRTFGIRFEYFCSSTLGLKTDTPIARV